ncbi:PemB family protein [Noviherbaspirillum pedocola]|uniref:Pectate lyase n=1 Tax=Noviherbaspirillum pedocola TaxID=2801341 RepID=A0A934STT7_9BURK|nr:pectate lyase [Noviherbaspirillum pedocola]MBK4736651.1 pectate lyase [Noviherbaspirillum pedocola]
MSRVLGMLGISASAVLLAACGGGGNGDNASATPASGTSTAAGSAPIAYYLPAKGEPAAYVDTRLQINFDAPPVLGSIGTIKVYKAADNSVVDTIDISSAVVSAGGETQSVMPYTNTEIDQIGKNVANLTQWRYVYYQPVTIAGNTATIKLHDGALSYDTDYYVTMDPGVLSGRVNGAGFNAITGAKTWAFHTKKAPASTTSVTVDDDGAADFRSVQGALNWIMANGCNTTCANAADAKTVTIRNGSYNEMLFLRNVNNLSIVGESRSGVVVYYDNYESYNPSTGGSKTAVQTTLTNEQGATRRSLGGGRAVLLVENADLLKLSNFTLQNTHVKQTIFNNQAETIYFNSATLNGSRFVATTMNFLSAQDTIQTKGWAWYYQSYIAGDVDFIWGSPFAALFEESELHTVFDPTGAASGVYSGGYLFQARAAYGYPGFVVLNSALTADANVPPGSAYLGRSGGLTVANGYCNTLYTSGSFGNANLGCDNIAYIGNRIGPHIASVGWFTQPANSPVPDPATPTASAGWRESGSMNANGGAADIGARSAYSNVSADLSAFSTRAKVFAGWNSGAGWVPSP